VGLTGGSFSVLEHFRADAVSTSEVRDLSRRGCGWGGADLQSSAAKDPRKKSTENRLGGIRV